VELLAIILGTGIKGKSVMSVARSILQKLDKTKDKMDIKTLVGIEGIGLAKACQIVASVEFSRRRLIQERIVVQKVDDILPQISFIREKKQEYFLCLSLNGANELIGNRVIAVGMLNSNHIHPREVFVDAITDRAASVILAHNHPSGALKPSPDDISTTLQLIEAGKIVGISVLDHIIVTQKGHLSLKEKGFI
jgi:DNA repair protein RadC